MKKIDVKKAHEILNVLTDGETFTLAEDHFLVLTEDMYQKYISKHETSSMSMELFTPKNYGIVLGSNWKGVKENDIIFFAAMRGHNILFHDTKDIAIKQFHKDDFLMKKNNF